MLSEILEGWGNSIKDKFNLLNDPPLKAKSEKRLLICNECHMRDNNTCSKKRTGFVIKTFRYGNEEVDRMKGQMVKGCGCSLSAKSLCDNCKCPANYWSVIENI
jgi:hypothetical protein